ARTGRTMKPNAIRIARKYRNPRAACPNRKPERPRGARRAAVATLVLDHDRGRLDDRGGRHALLEPELLDRVARDDRDETDRVADDHLDLRHQALDLDVGDDCVEAVACTQVRGARLAAEPLDLARRHHPAVALVALGPDAALTVPAAQRVDTDP